MPRRPVIGVCTALERAQWSVWDQQAALIPTNYLDAIRRAGGMALLLAPDPALIQAPDEALDLLDGLMLVGGADIDPASYGAELDPATVDPVPERDAFEIALTRRALARGIPLLGICRGMQLLNVALGGTLHQHLPDRLGHRDHLKARGSFEGADHDVELTSGSLAARAGGEMLHGTKSHHHQGVDRVGEGLVVTGVATLDGLPEALELPSADFVAGRPVAPGGRRAQPRDRRARGGGARVRDRSGGQRDDRVELDERVAREAGDGDGGARWRIRLEERAVDLVDGREVGHVAQVDGDLDRVGEARAGRDTDRLRGSPGSAPPARPRSSPTISPVSGCSGIWPEQNSSPPARIAWT